jgi:methionyl-tRNA synthetase
LSQRAGLTTYVVRDDDIPKPPAGYIEALDTFRFDIAINTLWECVERLNHQIETAKPWNLLKAQAVTEAREHIRGWLRELYRFAYWVEPVLPDTSRRICEALALPETVADHPLFPRLQ